MVPIHAVVFDLGDVLVSWQPPFEGNIDAKTLKRAMTSQTWHEFDRGNISEDECFQQIGNSMDVCPVELCELFEKTKLSLSSNSAMIEVLRTVRAQQTHLKIYLASNISKPHWAFVKQRLDMDWGIFDEVFISAEIGMRKPDICFYEHILDQIGHRQDPSSVVYFDDKLENVATAQALGMGAILFEDAKSVKCQLMNRLANPVTRGIAYLEANAGRMWSISANVTIKENFAQLLILEASGGRQDLVSMKAGPLLWNYFQERPNVSTLQFPDDFDTTSIAFTVLEAPSEHGAQMTEVLDLMLQYRTRDGLPSVYADHTRPRFDPVVCVHIFTLFHLNRRSSQLEGTWVYIMQILKNRAYGKGTYYYSVPDYFLFSLSRLLYYCREKDIPLPETQADATGFSELFRSRCLERVNSCPDDALSLAVRIIACLRAGVAVDILRLDADKLRLLQEEDGGWPMCEIYKIPSAKAGIGNRGVVTALAIKALEMTDTERKPSTAVYEDFKSLFNRRGSWNLHLSTGLETLASMSEWAINLTVTVSRWTSYLRMSSLVY